MRSNIQFNDLIGQSLSKNDKDTFDNLWTDAAISMLNLSKRLIPSGLDEALNLEGINYEKIDPAKISELIAAKKILIGARVDEKNITPLPSFDDVQALSQFIAGNKIVISIPCKDEKKSDALGENMLFAKNYHLAKHIQEKTGGSPALYEDFIGKPGKDQINTIEIQGMACIEAMMCFENTLEHIHKSASETSLSALAVSQRHVPQMRASAPSLSYTGLDADIDSPVRVKKHVPHAEKIQQTAKPQSNPTEPWYLRVSNAFSNLGK